MTIYDFFNQKNHNFIASVFQQEEQRSAAEEYYRWAYVKLLKAYGREYFALGRGYCDRAVRRAIASVYVQYRLGKLNLDEVNLHRLVYDAAWQNFWNEKYDLIQQKKAGVVKKLQEIEFW